MRTKQKPRNLIAKDLRSPKYRMRVVDERKRKGKLDRKRKHRPDWLSDGVFDSGTSAPPFKQPLGHTAAY